MHVSSYQYFLVKTNIIFIDKKEDHKRRMGKEWERDLYGTIGYSNHDQRTYWNYNSLSSSSSAGSYIFIKEGSLAPFIGA